MGWKVNGKPGVLDFYRVAMELIFSWPQAGCLLISLNARTHWVNQSFLFAAQRDFISLAAAEHNMRMNVSYLLMGMSINCSLTLP
jgi:hypothetical protein